MTPSKTEPSKELATTDTHESGLEIVNFRTKNPARLAELAEELDGIEGVQFEKIKIPAGGGTTWEIPSSDPDRPEISREIVGVIVDDHPCAALWLDDKDNRDPDEDDRPDVLSVDGKTQVINPDREHKFTDRNLPMPNTNVDELEACPYNQFGSMHLIGKEGKGKATKNMWRLFILQDGKMLPKLVSLPPTSLKNFKNFKVNKVVGEDLRMCDVVTKITLKKETGGGNDYSVAQFEVVGVLNDDAMDAMSAQRAALRPMTRQVQIVADDYIDETATVDSVDDLPPVPSADEEVI